MDVNGMYHLVNSLVNPSNMIYFEVFELTFLFAIVKTLKIGPAAMMNSQPQLVCLLQMTNCLGNKRPLILCYKKKVHSILSIFSSNIPIIQSQSHPK